MIRIACVVYGLVLAAWLILACKIFGVFMGALPDHGKHDVSDRVAAVESARNGEFFTADTIATATCGKTVALRGTVSQVCRTCPTKACVVVDGVPCSVIEHVFPKLKSGETVIVGGKWDGHGLVECMVYDAI